MSFYHKYKLKVLQKLACVFRELWHLTQNVHAKHLLGNLNAKLCTLKATLLKHDIRLEMMCRQAYPDKWGMPFSEGTKLNLKEYIPIFEVLDVEKKPLSKKRNQ